MHKESTTMRTISITITITIILSIINTLSLKVNENDIPVFDTISSNNTEITHALEIKGTKWELEAQECISNGHVYEAADNYEYSAEFFKTAGNTTKATELFILAAQASENEAKSPRHYDSRVQA